MDISNEINIVDSSLWAAYGDALGFITELTDLKGLRYRTGADKITKTVAWKRKVGGRFGVSVTFSPGVYSDDTQLRLSTCRSIRSDGTFDVEAFAKVELPIWLSYSLGAGVGTKTAAHALISPNVTWYSNFYKSSKGSYIDSGGNGAAMRIQPHVWSCRDVSNPDNYMIDVVRNSICTHGNPRGLFGSILHAYILGSSIDRKELPNVETLLDAVNYFDKIPDLINKDHELSNYWLPTWEKELNSNIYNIIKTIKTECEEDIALIEDSIGGDPNETYKQIVEDIGALQKEHRGSGTKTAILSTILCYLFRDEGIKNALITCANTLQSDTDSIGTMAGALFGLLSKERVEGEIQDRDLLEREAKRLIGIRNNESTSKDNFLYPDIIKWKPPKTQMDAVGKYNNKMYLAGLGEIVRKGKSYYSNTRSNAIWTWLELSFGQSILSKHRHELKILDKENIPLSSIDIYNTKNNDTKKEVKQKTLFDQNKIATHKEKSSRNYNWKNSSIDVLTNEAIKSGFDTKTIGEHILLLLEDKFAIEKVVAYSAIIAKAKVSRNKYNK